MSKNLSSRAEATQDEAQCQWLGGRSAQALMSRTNPVPGALAACTAELAAAPDASPFAGSSGLNGSLGFSEAFQSSSGVWLLRNCAIGDFAAVLEQHIGCPRSPMGRSMAIARKRSPNGR